MVHNVELLRGKGKGHFVRLCCPNALDNTAKQIKYYFCWTRSKNGNRLGVSTSSEEKAARSLRPPPAPAAERNTPYALDLKLCFCISHLLHGTSPAFVPPAVASQSVST